MRTPGAAVSRVRARIEHGGGSKGLTLIELVVVLVVIAILISIAVPSILIQRNRAYDAVASASVRQALPTFAAYYEENETYVGMTPVGLRAAYDGSLHPALALTNLSATSYCAQVSVSGRTWRQNGPGAPIERASC